MEKEILNRGYITHMLTNEKGEIYGLNSTASLRFLNNIAEKDHIFYWSECYVEPDYMATIIRRGTLLVNPTEDKLQELFAQSKVNFSK